MFEIQEFIGIDTEFFPENGVEGGRPVPVCLVAKEFYSGRVWRLWGEELRAMRRPPFDTGPHTVLVAFFASSEIVIFRALGWPLFENVLCLYSEYRCHNNGGPKSNQKSLREVMINDNLPFMSEQ